MNQNDSPIEVLYEKAENFAKTSVTLFKLQAIDKSADMISDLTSKIVVISVLSIFILMFNIGVALWLGEILGAIYFGFLVVSGFYLLVAILLFIFRKTCIKIPVSNMIITELLKQKVS